MTKFTKNDLQIKAQLYQKCIDFVENRFLIVENSIKEIQESLISETKSSAGDKHETGRAMLQLEREKVGQQLAKVEKLKKDLIKIDISKTTKIIGLGSIVFTTQANYFISISAGILQVGDFSFFAISPNSPIGEILMGKTLDNTIVLRTQNFKILHVL
ncbi:MAG: 3-oxoacyl-ACP synthase [Gelidibacter sp.]